MIKYENECVGCEPEMGCLGSACPNLNVPHFYCDKCKYEAEELYNYNGEEWCVDCIAEDCPAHCEKCHNAESELFEYDGKKICLLCLLKECGEVRADD